MYDITPEESVQEYLTDKKQSYSKATIKSHKSRLSWWTEWCEDNGIESMNEVDRNDLHQYRLWRRQDGIEPITEKGQMCTLRVYVRWCEGVGYTTEGLSETIQTPSGATATKDEMVERETQEKIEEHYRKFEYASTRHVLTRLLMLGLRSGGIRGIDIRDYDSEDRRIAVVHRPPETPLKNGDDGERMVSLSRNTVEILDDYIEERRPAVEDDDGREPLITTRQGRPHPQTIRKWSYELTQPCRFTGECPHDREKDDCEAYGSNTAYECPSSKSPHTWRRGSITHLLREGAPVEVVTGRCNVDADTIETHYDQRTSREKMEARREWMDDIDP